MICVRVMPDQVAFWSQKVLTYSLDPGDTDITHLPDCTGWDWKPEPAYDELQANCGFKVGDLVKVTHKTEPFGWGDKWVSTMDKKIGLTGEILGIGSRGIKIFGCWCFPCTSLVKVKSKYRPFANNEELGPSRSRWVKPKERDDASFRITGFSLNGVSIDGVYRTYQEMFDSYTFEDGSPYGIRS